MSKHRKKRQPSPPNIIKEKLTMLSKTTLGYNEFLREFDFISTDYNLPCELEILRSLGLSYHLDSSNQITLKSRFTPISHEVFCIVDIETNGTSFSRGGYMIEIGAIKWQNGQIIDEFSSLVHAKEVPTSVSELTGITTSMLRCAPSVKQTLADFKRFLKDSVFVAHNAGFDFGFISGWCERCGYGPLLNQSLCTLELSRRCIDAPKHGLESLKQILNIHNHHHRALNDAISAASVLSFCIARLPSFISTTQDLIDFSRQNTAKLATRLSSN